MNPFRSDLPAFYYPDSFREGEELRVTGDELRHIRSVRLREGDPLLLLDGRGGRAEAAVATLDRRFALLSVEKTTFEEGRSRPYIALGFGLLSDRTRVEWIVEKGVELGAAELLPLRTARSEGHFREDRAARVAVAALKQSQRSFLPEISGSLLFDEVVERYGGFDAVLLCHEEAPLRNSAADLLSALPPIERLLLLVGPEGGFAPEEVETAVGAGARVVSLGAARLRAETAAIAVLVLAENLTRRNSRTLETAVGGR